MSLYTLSDKQKDQRYFTLKLVHGQVIKERRAEFECRRVFFVRTPDEREVNFNVDVRRCKITEGQYVTLVLGEKGKKEHLLNVINYTQDNVDSLRVWRQYGMMSHISKIFILAFLALGFPGSCVFGVMASNIELTAISMVLFAIIVVPVMIIWSALKGRKMAKKVDAVIKEIRDNTSLKDIKTAMEQT